MKIRCMLVALLFSSAACAQDHGHSHGQSHSHGDGPAHSHAAIEEKKVIPATDVSPEYIRLATNVEIVQNLEKAVQSRSSILTHEGLFGPLLFAERERAFFIELKPGMFLEEHPHDTGSVIYTVRGRWVLASEGKRHVMEAGSLFRFGDNMPTGWEAPFGEGALLLIVKTKQEGENYETFNRGIKSMQAAVDVERQAGTAFYFDALKPDHPAIVFARSVNPDFDSVLANIKY